MDEQPKSRSSITSGRPMADKMNMRRIRSPSGRLYDTDLARDFPDGIPETGTVSNLGVYLNRAKHRFGSYFRKED